MRHLNIKNYRNFKDMAFCLKPLTILTGENNTGKTSLLKLIETVTTNTTLNFQDTFFENTNIKDIFGQPKKTLEIFLSFSTSFKSNLNEKGKNKIIFEKYDIKPNPNYTYPLINKIITCNNSNKIISFEFEYKINNKISTAPEVENIIISEYECGVDQDKLSIDVPHDFIEDINEYIQKNDYKWYKKINLKDCKNSIFSSSVYNVVDDFYNYQIFKILEIIEAELSIKDLFALYIFLKEKDLLNNQNKENVNSVKQNVNSIISSSRKRAEEDFNSHSLRNSGFYYIGPIRPMFKEFYIPEDFKEEKLINNKNLQTNSIKIFYENQEYLGPKINNFFSNISNLTKLEIIPFFDTDNNQYFYYPKYSSKGVSKKLKKLKYSGTGISQLFPILTAIYFNMLYLEKVTRLIQPNSLPSYDNEIRSIIIEQPELHLHPKAQDNLGALFIDYLKKLSFSKNYLENHSQKMSEEKNFYIYRNLEKFIIIETHSSFLINSMRKSIYKSHKENIKNNHLENPTKIETDNLTILYLYNTSSETRVDYFSINSTGRFSGNVKKYLNFYVSNSFEMIGI